MNTEDKKDLQERLEKFSFGDDEYYKITRIEANYLKKLINDDWREA